MKQKKPIFEDEEERDLWHIAMVKRFDKLRGLAKDKREQVDDDMVDEVFGRGVVDVDIRIPLKDNFVNIRESIILNAQKEHKLMRVNVPDGSALWEPDEWRKDAQITYKKFKYDTPLKLYGKCVFK